MSGWFFAGFGLRSCCREKRFWEESGCLIRGVDVWKTNGLRLASVRPVHLYYPLFPSFPRSSDPLLPLLDRQLSLLVHCQRNDLDLMRNEKTCIHMWYGTRIFQCLSHVLFSPIINPVQSGRTCCVPRLVRSIMFSPPLSPVSFLVDPCFCSNFNMNIPEKRRGKGEGKT